MQILFYVENITYLYSKPTEKMFMETSFLLVMKQKK